MKLGLIIGIIMITLSCSDSAINDKILKKSKDINFHIDGLSLDFSTSQYLKQKTKEYILIMQQDKKAINIFNLETGLVENQISMPSGISLGGFYAKNMDSIFVLPKYYFKIGIIGINDTLIKYIIDFDIKELLALSKQYDFGTVVELAPTSISPFIVQNGKIFITNMVNPDFNLNEQKPFFIINLADTSINTEVGQYPRNFEQIGKTIIPFHFLSFCRNMNNQTIFSYMADHNLYVYDDNKTDSSVYKCVSKNINSLPQQQEISKDDNVNKRLTEEAYYTRVFYDKYRSLYYRIAKHNAQYKDKSGLLNVDNFNFSILVIDSTFKVVGEQVFNNKEFLFNSMIVTQDGIMLKYNDLDENKVKFAQFDVIL